MCFKDKGANTTDGYAMTSTNQQNASLGSVDGSPSVRRISKEGFVGASIKGWREEREAAEVRKELKRRGITPYGRTLSEGNVNRKFDDQAVNEAMNPKVYGSTERVNKWMSGVEAGGSQSK